LGKGLFLVVVRAVSERVEEHPREAVEEVALRGNVAVTCLFAAVIVGSGARGGSQGCEGPDVADGSQPLVLDPLGVFPRSGQTYGGTIPARVGSPAIGRMGNAPMPHGLLPALGAITAHAVSEMSPSLTT
jgi:hypothetical protein